MLLNIEQQIESDNVIIIFKLSNLLANTYN